MGKQLEQIVGCSVFIHVHTYYLRDLVDDEMIHNNNKIHGNNT